MARSRLVGTLLLELLSLLSLQRQLFDYVHDNPWDPTALPTETAGTEALYCLEHRGQHGKWVQDWEYAKIEEGFAGMPQKSYPPSDGAQWETSWRWQEDSGCAVQLMDTSSWCEVMRDLNISRIYTAGDSTMLDFGEALRSLLSKPNLPTGSIGDEVELPCGQLHAHKTLYQLPWELEPSFLVDNYSGRNLVILNIGTHMHSMENFMGNFTELMKWVDEWRRPNDIIFYRSTLPGHKGCIPNVRTRKVNWTEGFRRTPFANYSEYKATETTTDYERKLLESYNDYAKCFLADNWIRYLNVFNSTILRSDGHFGCARDGPHYFHPGPVGWWVHFLYSALLDVRKLEQQTGIL